MIEMLNHLNTLAAARAGCGLHQKWRGVEIVFAHQMQYLEVRARQMLGGGKGGAFSFG